MMNGKKTGKGKFFYGNGDIQYDGYYESDKKHGFGTYFFLNGSVFTGGWESNEKHGKSVKRNDFFY